MSFRSMLVTAASALAVAAFAAPQAQAGTGTSCDDWGNYTVCRTTSYDISTGSGYTIDCYYYADGSGRCS